MPVVEYCLRRFKTDPFNSIACCDNEGCDRDANAPDSLTDYYGEKHCLVSCFSRYMSFSDVYHDIKLILLSKSNQDNRNHLVDFGPSYTKDEEQSM